MRFRIDCSRFKVLCGKLAGMALLLPLTAGFALAGAAAELPRSINFGTHAVGTVFNAVGTGLGKVATDHGPIRVVVQPFSGPPAWLTTMNREGKPEIGIINVIDVWQAYTGKLTPRPLPPGSPEMKPPYSPHPNVRLLKVGTNLVAGILVRADSPIKSMADLKGKRLTWDFPAFPPNILMGLTALATAGMGPKDIVPVPTTGLLPAADDFKAGRSDVFTFAVGGPKVAEIHASIEGGVRFIVRCVANLARKAEKPEGGPNPFIEPEPDLLVGDIQAFFGQRPA